MEIQNNYMVCVRCLTYNHAPYIIETLNGFTMQETSFPFVCVIIDDASNDGEQNIIAQYIEENFNLVDNTITQKEETDDYLMVFSQHKTNRNCFLSVYYLKYNHQRVRKSKMGYVSMWSNSAKYTAVCEGDDYWTSKDKLQIQVDFMEKHPEYGMCYTKVKRFLQKEKIFEKKEFGGPYESFHDLIKENTVPTLSVMFKTNVEKEYLKTIQPFTRNWKMGDYPRWLWMAHEYHVKFIPICSGVYRILKESASHSSNETRGEEFIRNICTMRLFFIEYFHHEELKDKVNLQLSLFNHTFSVGNIEKAISYYKKIEKPHFATKIKYIIAKYPLLYNLFKGRLFYKQ